MRIPKKELKKLDLVYYDSTNDDYYVEDEIGNYLYNQLMSEHDYDEVVDIIDGLVESYYILTGSMGLWNGPRTIVPYACKEFDDLTNRMSTIDEIEISFDKDEHAIVVKGYHHDGTNVYYLRKPEWYTKDELRQLVLEINEYNRQRINEDSQSYFGKFFSRLTKQDLIDLLYDEYLEKC